MGDRYTREKRLSEEWTATVTRMPFNVQRQAHQPRLSNDRLRRMLANINAVDKPSPAQRRIAADIKAELEKRGISEE